METLQAILIALIGAFVGIFAYQTMRGQPVVKKEIVQVVEEPRVLPYWTAYGPDYGYWPQYLDSYWFNYVPFYGPITGGGSYKPWGPGGHRDYKPNHWDGRGRGHSGVAVGGGGGGHGGTGSSGTGAGGGHS